MSGLQATWRELRPSASAEQSGCVCLYVLLCFFEQVVYLMNDLLFYKLLVSCGHTLFHKGVWLARLCTWLAHRKTKFSSALWAFNTKWGLDSFTDVITPIMQIAQESFIPKLLHPWLKYPLRFNIHTFLWSMYWLCHSYIIWITSHTHYFLGTLSLEYSASSDILLRVCYKDCRLHSILVGYLHVTLVKTNWFFIFVPK